jgi:hypothetical protein
MVASIEDDIYATMLTFVTAAEVPSFVLYTQDANIQWQDQQEIHEILFSLVYYHFVHITASRQLDLPLHDALHRPIFGIGTIYGGIGLQATDEIIAVVLGFAQHGDMTSMQHVKGAEGYTNAFALAFEFFDVIEYHDTSLLPSPMSRVCT